MKLYVTNSVVEFYQQHILIFSATDHLVSNWLLFYMVLDTINVSIKDDAFIYVVQSSNDNVFIQTFMAQWKWGQDMVQLFHHIYRWFHMIWSFFFISHKSEALDCFIRYTKLVENKLNTKIKALRINWGREYLSEQFKTNVMKMV
jgi:hypothetical protein